MFTQDKLKAAVAKAAALELKLETAVKGREAAEVRSQNSNYTPIVL